MNFFAEEPSPERLAAFADGELGECDRARVAAWLGTHPEAAAEVAALRRLADVCRDTAPREPSPAAWDATFARVEAVLPSPAALPPRRRRPFFRKAALALAAAAAAVLVVVLGRPFGPGEPARVVSPQAADDPFTLASTEDVAILRMHGADTSALVVGQPPVEGALDWASHEDITVVQVERFEGRAPDMHVDGAAPMLLASSPPDGRDP